MSEDLILNLIRFQSDARATLGKLILNNDIIAYTLERPWLNNQQFISCIPENIYQCISHNGTNFQNVWKLLDVPNRDTILIHNGNFVTDTDGCILIGQDFTNFKDRPIIIKSIETLNLLRSILPSSFKINITNNYEKKL